MMVNRSLSTEVGKLLEIRRNELGMTQQSVASALRVQRTSISNIERGRQVLLIDLFVDLCNILEIDPTVVLASAIDACEGGRLVVDEVNMVVDEVKEGMEVK